MHALTGRAKASLVCKVFLESIAKTLKEHPKAPTPKKKVSAQFDISSRMVLHKPNQKPSLSYQQDFAYLSGRNARGRPFPWCSMSDCCSFVSWKYGQRLVEYGKEIHPQDLPYVWPNSWAETPSPTPKKNNRFQYANMRCHLTLTVVRLIGSFWRGHRQEALLFVTERKGQRKHRFNKKGIYA